MCLIAFAIDVSSSWPLVIAANRDESWHRPTLPLDTWTGNSDQQIVSGRDLRAGGTWLGTTDRGRVAFLTNVREVQASSSAAPPRSRGELVTRWLAGSMDAAAFMDGTEANAYGGFNLVLGDWETGNWSWLSNRTLRASGAVALPHGDWEFRALRPGVYGLSNGALDTPWPKTVALKNALDRAMAATDEGDGPAPNEALLWKALADRQRARSAELPFTGVSRDSEEALSSAFVDIPEKAYGTRCSTLLLAHRDVCSSSSGVFVQIEERTFEGGTLAQWKVARRATRWMRPPN
jgi:uncharacterized protein with NRDE domain